MRNLPAVSAGRQGWDFGAGVASQRWYRRRIKEPLSSPALHGVEELDQAAHAGLLIFPLHMWLPFSQSR